MDPLGGTPETPIDKIRNVLCCFGGDGCVWGSLRRELEKARDSIVGYPYTPGGIVRCTPLYLVRGGITLILMLYISMNANYAKTMPSWLPAPVLRSFEGPPWLSGIPSGR